jgi:hypothetical protein
LTALGRPSLPAAVMAVLTATIVAGLVIRWRTRIDLGTPLPPFLMSWAPGVRWPAAAVATVLALGCAAAAPWAIAKVRSDALFATLSYATTLAIGLAVGAARLGTPGWTHVFDLSPGGSWEASREYLPALPALRRGVAYYVGHFAQLLPGLPTHTKGNPPGPLVAMHLLSITTPGRLAAACMIVGSLVAPLSYVLGRSLGDERRGRIAAALAACSPCVLVYGFTSVDFVFAAIAGAVACLLVSRHASVRALGCVAAGIAVFFSWLLLAIPVWAVVVAGLRDGRRAATALAAATAAGVVGVTLVLAAVWGYDPIANFKAVHRAYGMGAAGHRPYAFWLFGSPVAWLTLLGPPIAWLALRSLQRGDPAAVALAVVVVISAAAGFTKGETERIWLPYVPLACAAAAATPIVRLRPVLLGMAVEALVIRALFGTVW